MVFDMQQQSSGPNLQTMTNEIETVNIADHIEVLLDQALEATFPASDPIALTVNAAIYHLA